jgi:hypothetical protein
MNHKSSIKIGRTIAERREHLETANERAAFRKKDKIKKALRIILTIVGFIALIAILIGLYFNFRNAETRLEELNNSNPTPTPTVEIIDEASLSTGGHLTIRMVEFINQVSNSLRELGYKPTKAVIPTGSIREVRIYLDGRNGFVKTTIDRGAGVTAEDADRMLRYLADSGIEEFEYIDVRIDGKAYWK